MGETNYDTPPSDYEVIQMMIKFGGSFSKALGKAAMHADRIHLARLKDAFPELWRKYDEIAVLKRERF